MVIIIEHYQPGGFAVNFKKQLILLITMMTIAVLVITLVLTVSRQQSNMITITLTDDGYLYVETPMSGNTDKTYKLFWETDGGSLISETSDTPAHHCYSNIGEKVRWIPDDIENNKFTNATVKIHLYEEIDYKLVDSRTILSIATKNITLILNSETNTPEISDTLRIFGNPVRADGATDWSEIYKLYENKADGNNYVVLRYRTGNTISSSDSICWETNAAPFSTCSFTADAPWVPSKDVSNKRILKSADTSCFNIKNFDNFYFTNESTGSDKIAHIKIRAFVITGAKEQFEASYNFDIDTNVT